MTKLSAGTGFASLFKKYRLRSEIETLSEFGDILAEEGMVYETSLFTKWQSGYRTPRDRRLLLTIIRICNKRGGIRLIREANALLEAAGQGYMTESEISDIPALHRQFSFQAPRKIAYYIGRQLYITKATNALTEGKTVLLYGQPGIGKTVIAGGIGHDVAHHFPDGVYWYQLQSSTVMDILASIAEIFGHNVRNIEDLTIRASVVRSLLVNTKALFVFDNLEHEDDIDFLLPNTRSCGVLFTSIHPCIHARGIDERIQVQPFTKNEALYLFHEILGETYAQLHTRDILKLYSLVEGLPLALHVAAKQVLHFKKSLQELISHIENTRTNLSDYAYENKSISSVLQICYEKLKPKQKEVFSSLAVFAGRDFSVQAVAYINRMTVADAQRQLESLYGFSLIDQSNHSRYRMHPFIRIFALSHVKQDVYVRAVRYYLKTIKMKRKTYFLFVRRELDNILPLLDKTLSSEVWSSVSEIWEYLSDYLWNAGRWDDLKRYSKHIYKLSGKHKDYAAKIRVCLLSLSLVYYWKNKLKRSERYIREGLSLAEKINDRYLVMLGKQRLGRVLMNTSKFEESEHLLEEAKAYFLSIHDQIQLAITITNIGETELRKGHLETALAHFYEAYQYSRSIQDISMKNICLAEVLFYIGGLKLLKKDWDEAQRSFVGGLEYCKKINEYSEISVMGYIGLALCFEYSGQIGLAKESYHRAREQIEFLGIDKSLFHHDTLFSILKNEIVESPICGSLMGKVRREATLNI